MGHRDHDLRVPSAVNPEPAGEGWWPYEDLGPTSSIDEALREIVADPTGIFWG